MRETRVFLVRHGETLSNTERRIGGWVDTPLSPRGLRQAHAAGRALASNGPLAAIYSSDLRRAHDTAQAIAEASGYPCDQIRLTSDLREHSLGVLDGLTLKDAATRHPEAWRGLIGGAWDYTVPEAESNTAVAARVGRALETAVRANQGGSIVVVSHLIAISHILRLVMEVPEGAHARVAFTIENTGIHRLVRRYDKTWWIEALNDTSHLSGEE
jgi:2,3-bisphosphoglycerate-dependent phosphoglycerate mutase